MSENAFGAKVDELKEFARGFFQADAEDDVTKLAIELCRQSCRDPHALVMGFGGDWQFEVTGEEKRLPLLQYPLRPAWTHYLRDARAALGAMATIRSR